jgi:hypothetical protein
LAGVIKGVAGLIEYLAALIRSLASLINDMVAMIRNLQVQISNQTSTRSNPIVPNINLIDQIDVRDYRIDMLTGQHASLPGQIASRSRQQRTLGGENSMCTLQH